MKFQVGFNRRFDHNFKAIKTRVENGDIGEPHLIRVTSRDPDAPPIEYVKVSGGMFFGYDHSRLRHDSLFIWQ